MEGEGGERSDEGVVEAEEVRGRRAGGEVKAEDTTADLGGVVAGEGKVTGGERKRWDGQGDGRRWKGN